MGRPKKRKLQHQNDNVITISPSSSAERDQQYDSGKEAHSNTPSDGNDVITGVEDAMSGGSLWGYV